MFTGMSAATPSRALRRITKDFGLAVVLVTSLLSPPGAHVATTTPTLITTPPAKLPRLHTTEASAAAAVATMRRRVNCCRSSCKSFMIPVAPAWRCTAR